MSDQTKDKFPAWTKYYSETKSIDNWSGNAINEKGEPVGGDAEFWAAIDQAKKISPERFQTIIPDDQKPND